MLSPSGARTVIKDLTGVSDACVSPSEIAIDQLHTTAHTNDRNSKLERALQCRVLRKISWCILCLATQRLAH